jgi:hypothetical protein
MVHARPRTRREQRQPRRFAFRVWEYRDPAPRWVMLSNPFFSQRFSLSPSTACFHRGPGVAPSEDSFHWPPCFAGFFVKGERPKTHGSKKKIMKTHTNSDSELKARSARQGGDGDKLPKIDFVRRNRNRGLPTDSLLNLMRREAPEFWELAEVVGRWVWIQFTEKQPRQITAALAELGFHWNNRRQVWQHPCGTVTARADFDPRRKYRSYFPSDSQPA